MNMDTNGEIRNMTPMPERHGGTGAAIGIAIVVILLALGGWYFFSTANQEDALEPVDEREATSATEELNELEADVAATDVEGLDEDLDAMEAEFESL